MKIYFERGIILFILLFPINSIAGAITCEDVALVKSTEAKKELHKQAQNRAQKNVEQFVGKKLVNPYINGGSVGKPKTLETTIPYIEVFWCTCPSMPLHSAYYHLYTSDYFNRLNFFGN